MKRIVIYIRDIQSIDWSITYQFIEGCLGCRQLDNYVLDKMKVLASLAVDSSPFSCDVILSDLLVPFSPNQITNDDELSFVFITKPINESVQPLDYVPLFILQRNYSGLVSIGIDLINIPKKKQGDLTFRFSTFCLFVKDVKPAGGERSLYFINEIIDDEAPLDSPDRFHENRVSSFKYKSRRYSKLPLEKIVKKQSSTKFYPLLQIDKDLFINMFQNKEEYDNIPEEVEYLKSSSEKIINQLNHISKLSEQKYSSLFEKWFVCAYFNSLSSTIDNKLFEELYPTLHSYYIGVYELVQNIIFHTEKREGWIYVYFCNQDNLSSDVFTKLSEYGVDFPSMYLRLGIYDFSPYGIIDTYNKKHKRDFDNLANIVDPYIIVSGSDQENAYLYLTYAAHLGIKTLVSSVLSHNGLFRIETSHNGGKIFIENRGRTLLKQCTTDNIKGTHYDIVLPISAYDNNILPYQIESQQSVFSDMLKHGKRIRSVSMRKLVDLSYHEFITDRERQDELLSRINDEISNWFSETSEPDFHRDFYALDMSDVEELTPNMIFRLLASMQMGERNIDVIILFNLSDEIINETCIIVKNIGENKNKENQPIWSREHAVVLINKAFRIQILCGESKQEISYLNTWFEGRYNGYTNIFSDWNNFDEEMDFDINNKYLLPYECLIYQNEKPLFLDRVSALLDKRINTNNDFGFLVDGVFTKIGSKMYVEKFYETDTLFLNSFFVDRLAFFLANDIIKHLDHKKNIVLIGYRSFSDLTIRKIQSYINTYAGEDIAQDIFIADDGVETEDNILTFKPSINSDNALRFKDSIFVLVVPVASTLSTHDKIVSSFTNKIGIDKESSFLNYCAILVRDGEFTSISPFEKDWQWNSFSHNRVETGLPGAGCVTYLVSKSSRWHNLIDDKSFPSSFTEEVYLNHTGDPSLNLWNMFGYPTVSLPSIEMICNEVAFFEEGIITDSANALGKYFEIVQRRIRELSPFIYVGHLSYGHNHHRYFFDTEEYVQRKNHRELTKWLSYIKEEHLLWRDHSKVPVIILPGYNKESTFAHLVNEQLFDNNALIICLEVSDSIDNVQSNYSFLAHNPKLFSFYFMDHAILTAETYEKTRISLSAIMNKPDFKFNGMLVMVNRLSDMKYRSISRNLDGGVINSFVHFFIPPSKERGEDCTLCGLNKHYDNLLNFSIVEACRRVIKENKAKFYLEYDKKREKIVGNTGRKYKRMELRNNLFFIVTCIQKNYNLDFLINDHIKGALAQDGVLGHLENAVYCYYNNLSRDMDSTISFLKAISFPPLSQYVYIRRIAQNIALNELQKVLSKSSPNYEDFCLLKTLLKHLSWLSSNAVIRKEVIIASWKLCFKVANEILTEIQKNRSSIIKENKSDSIFTQIEHALEEKLLKIEEFGSYYQFCIKNANYIDEAKSFYLGELLRTGNEIDIRLPLSPSMTTLYNPLFKAIKNCDVPKFSHVHLEKVTINNPFRIFLSNIYYDNTTIFRKTLANFNIEISKDEELSLLFYDNPTDYIPYDFEVFNNKIHQITEKMLSIVNKQYYYQWFRLLLIKDTLNPGYRLDANCDRVPLIKKLVYVLYAKMTINHIIKQGLSIEKDAKSLLQVFSAIMDADHSFISIKYNEKLYTLANYYTSIEFENMIGDLYCGKFLSMEEGDVMYPFIIKETEIKTSEKSQDYDNIRPKCLCCQLLGMDNEDRHSYFGAVTYLYYDNDMNFRIKQLENSRILLLLKPEIDKYIKACNKDKLFQLWLKNTNTIIQFKRINLLSNHRLRLDGWDFEKLDIENYRKIDKDFYMLSNVVISHLFSILTVEHEIRIKSVTKSIDKIFSKKFISLLDELNINRWSQKLNISMIIGDEEALFSANALIIQSFVIQCVENAYTKLTKKNSNEQFIIQLIIRSNYLEIKNNFPSVEIEDILAEKRKFDNLYSEDIIKDKLDQDQMSDYGMTLSSLLIYGNSDTLECKCGFGGLPNDPYFSVKLLSKNRSNK